MRPPRHLGDRYVDSGEVEEIPMSATSRAHFRELNLEACARIRDGLEGRNKTPEVLAMIDGGMGPPSVVYEPLFDPYAQQYDPQKWDKQARGASGKYLKSRRK
jgi:hypothetical protein